jgi:hypothetical protein
MAGRTVHLGSLHLGQTGTPLTYNEAALPFGGQLGQVYEKDGKFFRLVQVDTGDAVNWIDGGVAYWKTKSNYTVTADASDSEALANGVAGGTHKAITISASSNPYIFVQCGGDQAAVVVAASTVAADHMTGHASTDNVLTRTAAGTAPVDIPFATALSTRGTTTSDNGASVSNSSKVRWHAGLLIF